MATPPGINVPGVLYLGNHPEVTSVQLGLNGALTVDNTAVPPTVTIGGAQISSGFHVPVMSDFVGWVAAPLSATVMWTRMGSIVSCWGRIAGGTFGNGINALFITLPIARTSPWVTATDLLGGSLTEVGGSGTILGNVQPAPATISQAQLAFTTTASAVNTFMSFSFTYRVS